MRNTPYGSSFLVGPVDYEGRPHVKIKEVTFDPKTRTFSLAFEKGGSATVKMVKADTNRLALDVAFDKGIDGGPFAMLRSMYITEFNNDAARIAVREQGAKGWREDNIMKFGDAHATDIWIGRLAPSQHNTTSPDIVFNSFSDGPYPKRPKSEPPPSLPVTEPQTRRIEMRALPTKLRHRAYCRWRTRHKKVGNSFCRQTDAVHRFVPVDAGRDEQGVRAECLRAFHVRAQRVADDKYLFRGARFHLEAPRPWRARSRRS